MNDIYKLNKKLSQDGFQIGMVHSFYIAERKIALGAGFMPAWAELVTDRIGYTEKRKPDIQAYKCNS